MGILFPSYVLPSPSIAFIDLSSSDDDWDDHQIISPSTTSPSAKNTEPAEVYPIGERQSHEIALNDFMGSPSASAISPDVTPEPSNPILKFCGNLREVDNLMRSSQYVLASHAVMPRLPIRRSHNSEELRTSHGSAITDKHFTMPRIKAMTELLQVGSPVFLNAFLTGRTLIRSSNQYHLGDVQGHPTWGISESPEFDRRSAPLSQRRPACVLNWTSTRSF